ncbi:major facilitator superfamily domain-containing protein [Chytriomyces sp. MP71]|nr:major facilitator superfamily domain-containing protein [Chytriomyces sp. MP71]
MNHSMNHSRRKQHEGAVLLMLTLLLFGNFFAYETPAALNVQLQGYLGLGYSEWQYLLGLLFSGYSVPNLFAPVMSGRFVDGKRLPLSLCVCFQTVVVFGHALFCAGLARRSAPLAVFGRIVFGLGGETANLVQTVLVTRLFSSRLDDSSEFDDSLASQGILVSNSSNSSNSCYTIVSQLFALNLCLAVSKLGSIANSFASPFVALHFGVEAALWISGLACILSLLAAIVLSKLVGGSDDNDIVTLNEADPIEATPLLRLGYSSSCSAHSTSLDCTMATKHPSLTSTLGNLPISFWLLCLLFCCHASFYSFNNTASDFLQSKWYPGDPITAGQIMSIPSTVSLLLIPLYGALLATNTRGLAFLLTSFTLSSAMHGLLGYTTLNPIYALTGIGATGALNASLIYPYVAHVLSVQEGWILRDQGVHVRMLGTGCGVCVCFMNAALTVIPMCAAWILSLSSLSLTGGLSEDLRRWEVLELFYIGISGMGAICCLLLLVWFVRSKGAVGPQVHYNDIPPQ